MLEKKFKITTLAYVTGRKSTFWDKTIDTMETFFEGSNIFDRKAFWDEIESSRINEVIVIRVGDLTYYIQRTD